MSDPGHPETCNVCHYRRIFEPNRYQPFWDECARATRGCAQNKKEFAEVLVEMTEPFRKARTQWKGTGTNPYESVERMLQEGAAKARAVAQHTLTEVKEAFGLATR